MNRRRNSFGLLLAVVAAVVIAAAGHGVSDSGQASSTRVAQATSSTDGTVHPDGPGCTWSNNCVEL